MLTDLSLHRKGFMSVCRHLSELQLAEIISKVAFLIVGNIMKLWPETHYTICRTEQNSYAIVY